MSTQQLDKLLDYEIPTTPLYPLPQLVRHYEGYIAYYNANKEGNVKPLTYNDLVEKYPQVFTYDKMWRNWYKSVKQIADRRQLTTKPIKRQISNIWRYKQGDNERICYSEELIGIDTKTGRDYPFKHIHGVYFQHRINQEYDEAKDDYVPKLKGVEKIYWLDYKPEMLTELYKYKPVNREQKKFVVVMDRTYGGQYIFNEEEYQSNSIERLTKVALSSKGLKKAEVTEEVDTDDLNRALNILLKNPQAMSTLANHLNLQKKTQNTTK